MYSFYLTSSYEAIGCYSRGGQTSDGGDHSRHQDDRYGQTWCMWIHENKPERGKLWQGPWTPTPEVKVQCDLFVPTDSGLSDNPGHSDEEHHAPYVQHAADLQYNTQTHGSSYRDQPGSSDGRWVPLLDQRHLFHQADIYRIIICSSWCNYSFVSYCFTICLKPSVLSLGPPSKKIVSSFTQRLPDQL